MAASEVQTLLRKPLPFLFDPKNKLYPIIIVVTICLLVVTVCFSLVCIFNPLRGISSSTLTKTNEETDFIVAFINIMGGVCQSVFSVAWIIYHKHSIIFIKTKIYKIQLGVCCDKQLKWFSKEMCICYSLLVLTTISQGSIEIFSWRQFCAYVSFLMNISFSFVLSGQLCILLNYLGSIYNSLLDLKNYESSVKWYQFLSSIYDDVWKVYKFPVLLISMSTLLTSFTHLYLLFYPAFPGRIFWNILYASWIYWFFFPTLSTIRSCNYVIQEAKKFNEEIYWKMAKNKSNELLNNELLNFHIMACEVPVFTACGLFSLDNSLICSIICQITTYLVIILQVAKSSGMNLEPTSNV